MNLNMFKFIIMYVALNIIPNQNNMYLIRIRLLECGIITS